MLDSVFEVFRTKFAVVIFIADMHWQFQD